jgi:hypothetical protein
VNLTDSKNYPDSPCHLKVGDHAFITKPSAVMYKGAKLLRAAEIDARIASGHVKRHPDFSPGILKAIIAGAFVSDDMTMSLQSYLKQIP